MKRYAVFMFEHYNPSGGWNDFSGWCDTIEDARKLVPIDRENWQIVDLDEGKVVDED